MAWDYCKDVVTRDIRAAVNDYVLSHARPDNLTDEEFAAHVLREMFVTPVIAWHVELAERAAKVQAETEERAKEAEIESD
jgi:hypothetical protein